MTAITPKIDFMFFSDAPSFFIIDEVSGCWLADEEFACREAAQAYLDTHREEMLRHAPPALDPESVTMYSKTIDLCQRRLGRGEVNAEEAIRIVRQLAKVESRCADASLRQRLSATIEHLRALSDGQDAETRNPAPPLKAR